ncbi:MAG: D-aminoacylase [Ignavibacteria bacterium]|jgi:N-acyl-D-amino-acid deacylase|nr:D-aminoacylase [Ignavibacteria bacterium]MDH7528580.1 D-aminoacylase [Ignavibacteria bacterium]NPV11332.1 D-aminoacylase [Ignavibacteria bacterium]
MKKISRRKFIEAGSISTAGLLLMGCSPFPEIFSKDRSLDIIIKNGSIIDGTGKKEFVADIGIKDDKIILIGKITDINAKTVIDAKGLKVAPGFIDIHSHTDADLIINPRAESKIRQGVTTEITGQDGFSWGPIGGPELELTKKNFYEQYGEELKWRSIGDFLDDFSRRKFSVNIATMVGLGTIREFVVGLDERAATNEEIKKMQQEVIKAIEEGAIGISTGLEYTPGSFASTEELIELCRVAPEKFRLYATHMRNEDNYVLEAIDEAIEIAKRSNSRLQISHLKVSGKSNWNKVDQVIEKIEKAVNDGLEVHADRYTYVAYHTNLSSLFPLWAREGGTQKFLDRLKDKNLQNQIREFVERKVSNLDGDWNGVLISSIGKDEFKHYQGKTIHQLSEEFGMDGYETSVKVLLDAQNQVMMMGFGMEEKSTEKILAHPLVMISSDAGSHAPYPPMNREIAHPRAYGTFPRAIAKYVRERKICSLEEIIKKMTSMPADKLGLKERGRIEENKIADIVIFDYDKIQDKATFTEPHQYPDGIPYVIVNGKIVISNYDHTGAMPGQVLRLNI